MDNVKIHALQWYDNKIVILASIVGILPSVVIVNRFFKSENKNRISKYYNRIAIWEM